MLFGDFKCLGEDALCIAEYVDAAVEVEHDVPGLDAVDGHLGPPDTSQRGRDDLQVGGRRLRRQQIMELSPLVADFRRIASRVSRCSVVTA